MKTRLMLVAMLFFGTVMQANAIAQKEVTDRYKYYDNKKVGRLVNLVSDEKITKAKVDDIFARITESGEGKYELILPENIGVRKNDTVNVCLYDGDRLIETDRLVVPKMRHWNVLIYPHAHVDIGYTHTQEVVEFIHKQNLEQAILLGEKTKDYPEDARFVWNTEVTWAVERYLAKESPEKCARLIEGIRKGYISVDASYVNTNTSAAHEPELLELYSASRRISQLTGQEINTMVIVDIPGVSWGIPAIAAITGVKNFISLPNGGDRTGRSWQLNYRPRFWVGPDGQSKIFYIQPGPYIAGADKRDDFFFKNLGFEDTSKLPVIIKTGKPRDRFVDRYLKMQLPVLEADTMYKFDVFPMAWCMSDNVPIDADLPDAVKSWNEEFAYPHLRICGSKEIIEAYRKNEECIPDVSGDYSEYWTDGLGTSAKYTGHHREVKEKLMQAEILSCITGNAIPEDEISEAWRYAILGTEHTWAYIWPDMPISDKILGVKFGYFKKTDSLTVDLLQRALPETGGSRTIAVFNTECFTKDGLVKLPPSVIRDANSVTDESTGQEIVSQILSDGSLAFMATDVPAVSSKKYLLKKKGNVSRVEFPKETCLLSNAATKITVDKKTGDIVGMNTDGVEYANPLYATNINCYRYLKGDMPPMTATQAYDAKIRWKEYGPVVKTLEVVSKAEGCNSLTREITLLSDEKYIHIENIVDKIATTAKEGIHFGFSFNIANPEFHADVPWGTMQIDREQIPEGNRNWIAAQRWVNMSDSSANVTICSLNSPIFQVGDITANILGSATGSPKWITHVSNVPTVWYWGLNNHWHTNFALSQGGEIRYRYVIDPEKGPMDYADANMFAMSQSRQLISCPVSEKFKCEAPFTLSADKSVAVSCIRPVDGGKSMLVFLHSYSDHAQNATFTLKKGSVAYQTDAYGMTKNAPSTSFTIPARGITVVRIDK